MSHCVFESSITLRIWLFYTYAGLFLAYRTFFLVTFSLLSPSWFPNDLVLFHFKLCYILFFVEELRPHIHAILDERRRMVKEGYNYEVYMWDWHLFIIDWWLLWLKDIPHTCTYNYTLQFLKHSKISNLFSIEIHQFQTENCSSWIKLYINCVF